MESVIVSEVSSECNTQQYIQWSLSNLDTNGAKEIIIVSEVSSFQRLKCAQKWYVYLVWEKMCPV